VASLVLAEEHLRTFLECDLFCAKIMSNKDLMDLALKKKSFFTLPKKGAQDD